MYCVIHMAKNRGPPPISFVISVYVCEAVLSELSGLLASRAVRRVMTSRGRLYPYIWPQIVRLSLMRSALCA